MNPLDTSIKLTTSELCSVISFRHSDCLLLQSFSEYKGIDVESIFRIDSSVCTSYQDLKEACLDIADLDLYITRKEASFKGHRYVRFHMSAKYLLNLSIQRTKGGKRTLFNLFNGDRRSKRFEFLQALVGDAIHLGYLEVAPYDEIYVAPSITSLKELKIET